MRRDVVIVINFEGASLTQRQSDSIFCILKINIEIVIKPTLMANICLISLTLVTFSFTILIPYLILILAMTLKSYIYLNLFSMPFLEKINIFIHDENNGFDHFPLLIEIIIKKNVNF